MYWPNKIHLVPMHAYIAGVTKYIFKTNGIFNERKCLAY